MRLRVKGTLKNDLPGVDGYRSPWKTGKAAYTKRLQKVTGINRPST